MMNIMKNIAGTLAIILLASPLTPAFAQTASDTPPTDTTATTDSPATQETVGAETLLQTQDASALSDVASSTQETIPTDTLIQTQDPTLLVDVTASSTIPFDTGAASTSSTPDAPPILLDATTTAATDIVPIIEETPSADVVPLVPDTPVEDITPPDEVVATIPVEAIAPKSEFKFSIRSNRIATDKVPQWQKKGEDTTKRNKNKNQQTEDVISNAPDVTLDAVSGAPIVSGACVNVYYVILLYKNETDYSSDPASYILNKAYPCVNGQYTYTMNDVPHSIPSGTYYLLVGEMGERGSWTPITSLVPIDITR